MKHDTVEFLKLCTIEYRDLNWSKRLSFVRGGRILEFILPLLSVSKTAKGVK